MLCLAQRDVHTDVNTVTERRRGFRIDQARPIRVFDSAAARFTAGSTRDVSATGLRIQLPLDSSVSVGSMLSVAVGPSGDGLVLPNRRGMIPARVIWIHRDFRSGLTAGIEFITSIMTQRRAA